MADNKDRTIMKEALFVLLKGYTKQEGPFTDFKKDQAVLPLVVDWINGDWQRLRLLLNYVFERGERRGLALATKKITDLRDSSMYREITVWERDLLNTPLEDCIEKYNNEAEKLNTR